MKIPQKILALFGEFIIEHNKMDYKLKMFLGGFVEDPNIGHLLTSSQPFEFIRKRVNSIFKHIINDKKLIKRWEDLQKEITGLNNIRNDIAHSTIDIDSETKKIFVLTRFTEGAVLNFGQKNELYEIEDLKNFVSRLKMMNRKLSYLLHTTYKKYHDIVHYSGKGTMF